MFKFVARSLFYLQKFNTRVDRGKKQGLFRTAALIRGASIRTLKISKQTSSPGNPPFAKTRGGLRVIEFVVYGDAVFELWRNSEVTDLCMTTLTSANERRKE